MQGAPTSSRSHLEATSSRTKVALSRQTHSCYSKSTTSTSTTQTHLEKMRKMLQELARAKQAQAVSTLWQIRTSNRCLAEDKEHNQTDKHKLMEMPTIQTFLVTTATIVPLNRSLVLRPPIMYPCRSQVCQDKSLATSLVIFLEINPSPTRDQAHLYFHLSLSSLFPRQPMQKLNLRNHKTESIIRTLILSKIDLMIYY